jgi:hypothetical protein
VFEREVDTAYIGITEVLALSNLAVRRREGGNVVQLSRTVGR